MSQEIRRDALIVGINTYEYPRLKGLKAPAQDAEAIARMLTKYGNFRVRRLPAVKDKENLENDLGRVGQTTPVTLTQLEEALNQLFLPEGDYTPETALLFFSGHGLRKQKGRRYEGYLATSDVNPDKHHWGFSLQDLREILQDSPVRQQIVWLDCCHSGELFNFKENSQETIFIGEENLDEADPGNQEERDRCFITASRAFEVAREKASGTHGLLAAALLKGLNPEERPDGWVTTHTLADFINKELKTETQRPLCHNSGSPIILTTCKPKSVNSPDEGICPYKGLEYFKQEDAHFFWGRTALTDELIEQVRIDNFITVLGASGSGKSSVLRAGLLHQLNLGVKLTGSNRWQIYQPFTPGEHPLQNLEAVIGRAANELNQLVTEAETSRVVLVVDQFEECFTMCQDSREREQFFDCLLNAVEGEDNKLCLVLGMRADFLGKCAEYAGLANKIDKHLVTVKPMTSKELEEAIIKPAEQVGLQVEPQLVTRMIEDVADSPGSLPLLQYTLMELWKARREPVMNWLTLFCYEQLGGDKGGIKGILEKRANEVYESLNEEEKPVAQRIFLELTQLGEVADTRRRARKEDLINSQHPEALLDGVIRKLAEARLITTTEAGLVTTTAQSKPQDLPPTQTDVLIPKKLKPNAVIDITHEALIRHWEKLRDWVEDYRIPLGIERRIETDAKEWTAKEKPEGLLLREGRLIEAEDYQRDYLNLGFLDGVAQEFIEESIKLRDRLQREKDEQLKREQALNASLKQTLADKEKALTESILREQSARVSNLLPVQPLDGLVLAIQSMGLNLDQLGEEKILAPVQGSLNEAMKMARVPITLGEHEDFVRSVAFSPDGKLIVSGSNDNTVRLWDTKGNPVTQPFQGHEDFVRSVAFSPDGKLIVSGSHDKTVRLWDIQGNPIGQPFR
ncbi:nSTAND1 domain-containing NTPase, partial [Microcoleus sp. D3_18_C4]|uniref:nSTAND1 domain-containing NTPase n=1 Tax=Microcoleus sp. D3_18_C4 TaxID=3055335 RepID=UPI002FD4EB8B